jgi:hypothetical protein
MMRRLALALIVALAAGAAFAADAPPVAKPAPAAKPATADVIEYADLEHQVGARVIVRSRLGTTRTGTLAHWSPTAIRLRMDNGAELEMPVNTIRQVRLAPAPKSGPTPPR